MNTELTTPVYLVDDDESIRDSLKFLLEGYRINLTCFGSGRAFLESVDIKKPACLILDSRMPELSGQQVQVKLCELNSNIAIIYLTGHGDINMAVNAFRSGVCDFLQKPVKIQELLLAIKNAQQLCLHNYRRSCYCDHVTQLTKRERQILSAVVEGKSNKQISDQLFISVRTVEVHRSKVMQKLGANSIIELIKIWETVNED